MEWQSKKQRWALAIAVVLGLMFVFGFGSHFHITSELNFCSLYTKGPTNARALHEAYKALLNW